MDGERRALKASAAELLRRLPGPVSAKWPAGERFVAAGTAHRFEAFSADFSTWVVFWGPPGGESAGSPASTGGRVE